MVEDFTKPPEPVDILANRCISHVKNKFNFDLDYQYETLGVVDYFIKSVVAEESRGEVMAPGDPRRVQLVHLLAPTIGAYFGEVLRRKFRCRWRLVTDQAKDWLIEFDEVMLRFNPIGAAAEALVEQPIDSWGGAITTDPLDEESLRERLAASPPVLETDFFILTTRWEVLEIACDWLQTRYAANKIALPRFFSSADYDRVFTLM